ncbi:hypothetical protein [Kamptonema formosum]|uniref:hypothetical protein n=1 Tax=Kamptonema formosum TaxID=331992 RepID=UPI0012DCC505|nr:hypothetical protein [Oscillatoria sp. PCC 10802]
MSPNQPQNFNSPAVELIGEGAGNAGKGAGEVPVFPCRRCNCSNSARLSSPCFDALLAGQSSG